VDLNSRLRHRGILPKIAKEERHMSVRNQPSEERYFIQRQELLADMVRRVCAGDRCVDIITALEICLTRVFGYVAKAEQNPKASLARWLDIHDQAMRVNLGLDDDAENRSDETANSLPI
jgi:hypothetical protein